MEMESDSHAHLRHQVLPPLQPAPFPGISQSQGQQFYSNVIPLPPSTVPDGVLQPNLQHLVGSGPAQAMQSTNVFYQTSLPQTQAPSHVPGFGRQPSHPGAEASLHSPSPHNGFVQYAPHVSQQHGVPEMHHEQMDGTEQPEQPNGNEHHGDEVETFKAKFESPMKLIKDPPDLARWRKKLFHVDETIYLTEQDFQTYFPHVDNVYSHRSTQTYKLKPFISHYWDCRLKGRPPGTPKSTDPNKKNRRRVARERDLCDVKIKITEYKRGEIPPELQQAQGSPLDSMNQNNFMPSLQSQNQGWPDPAAAQHATPRRINAFDRNQKWFSIQRVNGNGPNGKLEGVAARHRHSLEDSDRVKKNSVIRHFLKNEPQSKSASKENTQKTYHKKATGKALATVKAHSKDEDLKLFGSCFCPFVQRVWISLEFKKLKYQYIEVDPYKKPQSLLEVSPKGLVPAIRHGPSWSCHDSQVIMEYLEDITDQTETALFPAHPQQKAIARLWTLHINSHIVPGFYRLIQEQDTEKQVSHATDLKGHIEKLVDAADPTGPFFLGPKLSFVDVQVAPWFLRLSRVLKPYRGWPDSDPDSRFGKWLAALEKDEAVKATVSTDELYLDSYERYAENRPNTSQVADAINSGRGLP